VNTHQNARLTVWGRAEAVRRLVQDGEPVTLVATALHVSVRTLYQWRRRFCTEGPAGLLDRSSRPHHSPRRTAERLVRRIVHLRTRQRLTGPEIALGSGASSSPGATGPARATSGSTRASSSMWISRRSRGM